MVDWKGFIPPHYIVRATRFKKVVLDPPSFESGSWVSAGRVFYDHDFKEYLMAVRPRSIHSRLPQLRFRDSLSDRVESSFTLRKKRLAYIRELEHSLRL